MKSVLIVCMHCHLWHSIVCVSIFGSGHLFLFNRKPVGRTHLSKLFQMTVVTIAVAIIFATYTDEYAVNHDNMLTRQI